MLNDQLEEELLAVNAIFGDGTVDHYTESQHDPASQSVALRFPAADCVLLLQVPSAYPDEAPTVIRPLATNLNATKGEAAHVVELARNVLNGIFVPGEVVLYTLLDALGEEWLRHQEESAAESVSNQPRDSQSLGGTDDEDNQALEEVDSISVEWVVADAIVEKKSIFIARACHVRHPADVASILRNLKAADKKVAKATHNIYAYRIRTSLNDTGQREIMYQDCDDDGESAAGSRLLHLLQLTDCVDGLVVVSRWYGGIKLGPDRFRLINSAAREALIKGGWVQQQRPKS